MAIDLTLPLAEYQQQNGKLVIIIIQLKNMPHRFQESRQRQIWILPSSEQSGKRAVRSLYADRANCMYVYEYIYFTSLFSVVCFP